MVFKEHLGWNIKTGEPPGTYKLRQISQHSDIKCYFITAAVPAAGRYAWPVHKHFPLAHRLVFTQISQLCPLLTQEPY